MDAAAKGRPWYTLFVLASSLLAVLGQYSITSENCKSVTYPYQCGRRCISFSLSSTCLFALVADIELMAANIEELVKEVRADYPNVNLYFNPDSALINNNGYTFNYPMSYELYRFGFLIDPCRGLAPDCCMNVFGSAEYPALTKPIEEAERVVKLIQLGSEQEVQLNYYLVYEDGTPVPAAAIRTPDDFTVINTTCEAPGVPYSYCDGKNYAYQRSSYRPACTDNNQSLDVLAGCYGPDGIWQPHCVAIAYSTNSFIGQCDGYVDGTNDPHCGTYIEVHQLQGTVYYPNETTKIAEVQVTNRNVSGFYTTVLPLTWMGDPYKVLCAYAESYIRVGSIVYIEPTSPVCCCAKPFKPQTRVGSVQCPTGPTGNGAYARNYQSLADILIVDGYSGTYPQGFCPIGLDSPFDTMTCAVYDEHDQRSYMRPCAPVTPSYDQNGNVIPQSYTSIDLDGKVYDGVCPYFDNCALTLNNGQCRGGDLVYSFIGQVGRATAVDNSALIPTVNVTFNDGRTSYQFNQDQVKLELTKSAYELWWVLRTPSQFVVQKRKGFNVTNPICTFDLTNNRYFPYAILDKNGNPLDSGTINTVGGT